MFTRLAMEITKELVERAVDLVAVKDNGAFEQLLKESPMIADSVTQQGISLLMFAAYCRNSEAIKLIRSKKESLDFYESVTLGDLPLVRQHLQSGAGRINQFAADGFSALGLACFFGHAETAEFLIEKGAIIDQPADNDFGVYPIHSACATSNIKIVRLLIDRGADVNVKQQSGVTGLHSAAHNGDLLIVKILVENGASLSAKMTNGQTPLNMARESNHREVIEYLENRSAQV